MLPHALVDYVMKRWHGDSVVTVLSNRFIRNGDATLGEPILRVAKAHAESMVEPDRVADDFRWKSISAVPRRVAFIGQVCDLSR